MIISIFKMKNESFLIENLLQKWDQAVNLILVMLFVEMLRKSPKNALYKYIQFHDDTNVLPYF